MLRATGNHVIFKPAPPPAQSQGGIMLPIAYEQPTNQGTVISVGAKVQDVKPGDVISFSWIDCRTIEHGGQQFKLLDYRQILGLMV